MSDTEDPTVRLLQEMREIRTEMRKGFEDANLRLTDMSTRIDGLAYILAKLAGHIHQLGNRLGNLEGRGDE